MLLAYKMLKKKTSLASNQSLQEKEGVSHMKAAKKGDWVQISAILLPAGSRAPQVPDDTQKTNLVMWTKGTIQENAKMGEIVEIITLTGRHERGELCDVNPNYTHTYGTFIPELIEIQKQLRQLLHFGGEK